MKLNEKMKRVNESHQDGRRIFMRSKPLEFNKRKFTKNALSIELRPLRNSHDLHPLRSNLTIDNCGSKGSLVSSSLPLTDALDS